MKKVFLVCCLLVLLCFASVCQAEQPHLTPAQGDNGLWGYKNEAGEWVFEPQWSYVGVFRDGVAVVDWSTDITQNKGSGILRDDGMWVLPRGNYIIEDRFYYEDGFDIVNPKEDALLGGRENGFILIATDTPDEFFMGLYFIPTDTLMMPCWAEVLFSMEPEDNVIFPVCDPETYLWGYVDWYGEVVIPCQYEYADCFTGGYAAVSSDTGVIDLKGDPVDVKITLESVEEIRKEGLQVVLAARVRIDSNGAGPVKAFHFFEDTPIGFSQEPMADAVWFNEATWHTHYTNEPLPDGIHTLLLTSPWGIDYARYIEKGNLCGKVNCDAWVEVEIALSE